MEVSRIEIEHIPAIVWGRKSDKVYLFVHGKMSEKESAEAFAAIAEQKGYQTISFDLPQHGERKNEDRRCDIWNGIQDLTIIADYVILHWAEVSLFACSLGAYFCLNTYHAYKIRKCLFQSPIVDMAYLIKQMMMWFEISEKRLRQEKEISTPIDLVTWEYYQYVKSHPIQQWNIPTHILYGGKDNLQSLDVIQEFSAGYDCVLTVSEDSEHSFMEEKDEEIIKKWLINTI